MKTCSNCQVPQDESEFPAHKQTKDRLASWCKTCRRTQGNPQRQKLNYTIQEYKSIRGCQQCGEKDPRVLEFHHPGKKDFNISHAKAKGWDWEKIKKEIETCIVVCANCHRRIHVHIYPKA